MTYNETMKDERIPQVVVETTPYQKAVEKFWDEETQIEFKNYIGVNFALGDVIPGAGGIRKIRWQANGYKIGYASYWNANVVTEVTDGTVHMIGVTIYTDPEGCIKYYDFLTSLWLREVPNEKPFLLIDHYEALPENMVPYCVQVYADACYSVYDITDLETFRELLNS